MHLMKQVIIPSLPDVPWNNGSPSLDPSLRHPITMSEGVEQGLVGWFGGVDGVI